MKEMKVVVLALALVCLANLNYQSLLAQMRQLDTEVNGMNIPLTDFLKTNKRLLIPINNELQCSCGCFNAPLPDCPPLYDIDDVQESAHAKVSKEIQEFMEASQIRQKRSGEEMCHQKFSSLVWDDSSLEEDAAQMVSSSGGYCFHALMKMAEESNIDIGSITYPHLKRNPIIRIPMRLEESSLEILEGLYQFIHKEDIRSITDLGAGVGAYGAQLEEKLKGKLVYRGFDGASDVEDYTRGYIRYFDLSLPMNIPKSDWVLSLNVGEFIPSTVEGMVIRNLTANNCQGIILSWKTPDQPGIGHVNLHNNQYLINMFAKLGYRYDDVDTRLFKDQLSPDSPFRQSLMILRRLNNVCSI